MERPGVLLRLEAIGQANVAGSCASNHGRQSPPYSDLARNPIALICSNGGSAKALSSVGIGRRGTRLPPGLASVSDLIRLCSPVGLSKRAHYGCGTAA